MMSGHRILRVRVMLSGRPIKSYSFDQDTITVGRSPDCHVFLDNSGVSREHLRIVRTPEGYFEATEMGSANGTLLNDKPLKRSYISTDDVIQIGKFTLWMNIEIDRRDDKPGPMGVRTRGNAPDGTTVLTTAELERMVARARDDHAERSPAPVAVMEERPRERARERPRVQEAVVPRAPMAISRPAFVGTILMAFLLGSAAGASTLRLLMMR
jgi:predicted component of type VI protein secretion system